MILTRRVNNGFSTSGAVTDDAGAPICKTLERGPANQDHARIPAGRFDVVFRPIGQSKFDASLAELLGTTYQGIPLLVDVPGRANIEIHPANWVSQLEGCIAPGMSVILDPQTGYMVPGGSSKPAFSILYRALLAEKANGAMVLQVIDEIAGASA